jgi:adenylosuccinate synthase
MYIMARITVVAGLGFGDEGKGATVDYLCRQVADQRPPFVVRYNGGPQCSHAVVTPEGKTHLFHQFGSGTLTGAKTWYDRAAIFDPIALIREADALVKTGYLLNRKDALERFYMHESCLVATPYHQILNQICARRVNNGTCGFGVGITRRMYLEHGIANCVTARDCTEVHRESLLDKLRFVRDNIVYEAYESSINVQTIKDLDPMFVADTLIEAMHTLLEAKDDLLFGMHGAETYIYEGAQGFLLDQDYGFAPNNTWSDLSLQASVDSMAEHDLWDATNEYQFLGVIRSGHTRHGIGPLPGQTHYNDVNSQNTIFDTNNPTNEYQGGFRFGKFDTVLFRYAVENIASSSAQLTGIVVNHMDQLASALPVVATYEQLAKRTLTDALSRNSQGEEVSSIVFPSAVASRHGTEILLTAKPQYDEHLPGDEDFLKLVARIARKPVVIRSYGPTHEERSSCNITPC